MQATVRRWGTLLLAVLACAALGVAQPENVALGCRYTCVPEASYPLTKDEGDARQLTDGRRVTGECLWTDKAAVGWSNPGGPVTITVDLGSRQPISGGSLSTAAGRASVSFPFAVHILVSDDGETFHGLGELVADSARHGLPSPTGYSAHVYRTAQRLARGRYVRFVVVPSSQFFMCDEVEVYAGHGDQKDQPRGEPVPDVARLVASQKLTTIVKGRIALDLLALEQRSGDARIGEDLWDELHRMAPVDSVDWRRGVPYNDLHRRVFQAHAEWARESLGSPFLVWKASPWDPLGPFDLPEEEPEVVPVEIHAMDGEYRSGAFNLTNLTDDAVNVEVAPSLDGLLIEMLEASEVIHVEAQDRTVVANALRPVPFTGRAWSIEVPAGVTRQVWLTAHPVSVEARTYNCVLEVGPGEAGPTQRIPVKIVVHPFQFPAEPTLAVTTWDYCYSGGYIRHPRTWRTAIQQMREHFITVPWFGMNAVVWRGHGPKPWIDDQGNITAHILWGRLEEWIRHWPDARYYALILEWREVVPDVGLRLGNPVHEQALRRYFKSIVARFTERGVPGDRVLICPVDEPWQESKSDFQIRWSKLIKQACPEVSIFCDPTWKDPAKAPSELYGTAEVVCPNLQLYYGQGGGAAGAAAFYQTLREQGKALWTYQCSGPVKTLDPYTYFRLQAWHAFREGMTGIGYWALADMRHKPFGIAGSWNDFSLAGTNFSITYWDALGVSDSKQLEAIREGVEDYEYLTMLRDAIQRAPPDVAAESNAVLGRAVEQIGGSYSAGAIEWRGDRDRGSADRARLDVLRELHRIQDAQEAR